MDIARIKIDYDQRNNFTTAQVEEFKAAIFNHPVFGRDQEAPFKPVEDKEDRFSLDYWTSDYVVDFDLIRTIPCMVMCRLRTANSLEAVTEPRPPAFNEKVEVSVPSNNLMGIKMVKVVENACTESMQEELNAGWVILAICPQPDQRRPDYIVGRI